MVPPTQGGATTPGSPAAGAGLSAGATPASVSVVVPVHDALRWVGECLDSIEAQTVAPLEVICVDDGSTDGSAQALDSYARAHVGVSVVHQRCSGVSAARNAGLGRAKGEFVLFVDADDTLHERLVERVVPVAERLGADMTIFGFEEYWDDLGRGVVREMCDEPGLAGRAFRLEDLRGPSTSLLTPNVWRVLWRRDFVARNGLAFHEDLSSAEDLAFIYEALCCSPRLALVNEVLYRYRRDGNGASLTRRERGLAAYRALDRVFAAARSRGVLEQGWMARHLVNIVLSTADYSMMSAATRGEYDALFRAFQSEWRPFVERHERLIDGRWLPFWNAMRTMDEEGHLFEIYGFMRDRDERTTADLYARDLSARGGGEGAPARDDVAWLDAQAQIAELRRERERLAGELAAVRASHSYRVGNALMRIPAALRRMLRGEGRG